VRTGSATSTVSQQLKDAKVHEHVAVAGERGREYGVKGWGFLKSAYASVASGVETVARDNGYKVDLGEPHNQICSARLLGYKDQDGRPRQWL